MHYLLPFIGSLIGWLTNWLAVKMLFHPRKPRTVFGVHVQGVFPKRQKDIAHQLGRVVATKLLSSAEIKETLFRATRSPKARYIVEQHVSSALSRVIPSSIPTFVSLVNPRLAVKTRNAFLKDINSLIDSIIEHIGDNVEEYLDVETIVRDKVAGFSNEKLEEMLQSVLQREFRFIEIIGAVVGFVIGLSQLAIMLV